MTDPVNVVISSVTFTETLEGYKNFGNNHILPV
jgi:hypothetical protein